MTKHPIDPTRIKNLISPVQVKWICLGSTEDVDTCDHCGKTNLLKTVIFRPGEDAIGEECYFGTTCAGRYFGRPISVIRSEARRADIARRQAEREERERQRREQEQAEAVAAGFSDNFDGWNAWISARAPRYYADKVEWAAMLRRDFTGRLRYKPSTPQNLAAFHAYVLEHFGITEEEMAAEDAK